MGGVIERKMAEEMEMVIPQRVEPNFFMNGDVDQNDKYLIVCEICYAVRDVVERESYIDWAQKIGGLWRVYVKDPIARAQVLVTGISLRDIQINMYDKNPYLHPGKEDVETTRLYIQNIPLSYGNDVITNYLKNMGLEMLGSLKYVRARTPEGKLTNVKTGDRFVEIVVPDEPLPKKKAMGPFTASLYYKEQKQTTNETECGNCRQTGHIRRNCSNEAVCYDCLRSGHKNGSPLCPGLFSVETDKVNDDEKKDEKGEEEGSVGE